VAPVGQFSIANAIPEQQKTVLIRDTGHFRETEHDREVREQVRIWCEKHFVRES